MLSENRIDLGIYGVCPDTHRSNVYRFYDI